MPHDDSYLRHQRRRWLRHDAHLWIRPDAARFSARHGPCGY
jgi:c-di-GMP-binding flagellar brake protein YcgR